MQVTDTIIYRLKKVRYGQITNYTHARYRISAVLIISSYIDHSHSLSLSLFPLSLINIYKYNFDIAFSKLHETSNKLSIICNETRASMDICIHAYTQGRSYYIYI